MAILGVDFLLSVIFYHTGVKHGDPGGRLLIVCHLLPHKGLNMGILGVDFLLSVIFYHTGFKHGDPGSRLLIFCHLLPHKG